MSSRTRIRHAEAPEALRNSLGEGAYEQVLENLDAAVAFIGLDGSYLKQNQIHSELLGYSDAELSSQTPAIHLGEEVFTNVAKALQSEGQFQGDVVSTTRTGDRLQLQLTAFTIHDESGKPMCYVGIKRDVRSVASAEDRLERMVSLLQATLDSTADGMLVVDRAGKIVQFNRRFVKMWGLPLSILATRDDQAALAGAVERIKNPDVFLARVKALYDHPEETSCDVIELLDGRIFERYSRPQRLGEEIVGRVWSFRDITNRTRAESALRDSEQRYRKLFEDSRHAIYLTTRDGFLIDANPAALRLFGVTDEEASHMDARELYVDPAERERFQEEVEKTGAVMDYPVRLRSKDGREMECVLTSTVRRDSEGGVLGYQGIIDDVTERRETERALRESEAKFRSLIENASDTITVLDATGLITYESPSLERVLGYRPEDLIGRNVFEYVHTEDAADALGRFQHLLSTPDQVTTLELRFRHKDGTWRILDIVGRNLLHDEKVRGIIVNARDVSERKRAEARLLHNAFHDKLTQLPNRAVFLDRVTKLLQRGKRKDADCFAVLFLDLDRFKVVNDSLGHLIGDQLLVALARRLEESLRPGDTVARFGGDEFAMLLDGASMEEASGVADRLREDLMTPFQLGSHQVYATASMGIVTSDRDYASPEEMLRDADLAMYRAKDTAPGDSIIFDSSMRKDAVALLRLETDLRQALDRGEFEMHYQPIIHLNGGTLNGFEALLRWRHPDRGLLAPGEFLQTAEDTGLIVPLGWWALDTVCEQLSKWAAIERTTPAPTIQVNVSPHQLERGELLDRVAASLALFDAPAELLHLELTEDTMMENAESTVETLYELKKLKIGLSIDDFGTGYSSLSYLHRFPTDSVKIDRSFVSRMGPRGRDSGIVRTIVDLAHDLGMHVVAEGIETEAHAALLRGMRCECGQGFLFAKAMAAVEATELLVTRKIWES
ncbi:MAG: hypothetical protein BMS9Abin29_0813 [Gemmatimonadota bacterium]|nr:MAG: hypothetical protein BMS9Abin29_0813 [Gemmatimonadota bacterium]